MPTRRKPSKRKTATRRQCGTLAVHFGLLEQDPNFRQRQMDIEHATARLMATGVFRRVGLITIPVVVHVVFNIQAENISTGQIRSQMRVLNKDFRAKNTDKNKVPAVWQGLVADANIKFILARKDPRGKTTTGITRTHTNRTSFSYQDDTVKSVATGGVDPWPTDKYLNIWVCKLAGGILGYAQFPGGPAETDGVVIRNTEFGTEGTVAAPYNLGRTTTHEIGHWLNLGHIWGDSRIANCRDSDLVDDTPNQEAPNYGKPTFPHVSCENGPNGDMFMNYMDYVDDNSMQMFTAQQVLRMQAVLDGPRSTIGR